MVQCGILLSLDYVNFGQKETGWMPLVEPVSAWGGAYVRQSPCGTLDTMSVTAKQILAPLESGPRLLMEFVSWSGFVAEPPLVSPGRSVSELWAYMHRWRQQSSWLCKQSRAVRWHSTWQWWAETVSYRWKFEFHIFCLLFVWPWVSYLTTRCLGFLCCRVGLNDIYLLGWW